MTELSDAPAFTYGWGSAAGLLPLVRPVTLSAEEMADRYTVEQTVRAYGWAIDENRFDLVSDLLGADVEFSGIIAGVGPLPTITGRDTLTAWVQDYMSSRHDQMRHSLGNVLVTELEGGQATALAYLTLHSTTADATTVLATAFYRFTLSRSGDAWFLDRIFGGFDKAF